MRLFDHHLSLENEFLLLRPSKLEDAALLFQIAETGIWAHSSTNIHNHEDMEAYLQKALTERMDQQRQQLTLIDKLGGRVIGCSSFENISDSHKRLEIGWTWLGKAFQGKGYNRVAKFLMLQYVFETLEFERVEFRTRGTNIQSQKALAKIGAIREGTIRSYFIDQGQRHDFVYFSILKPEWLKLKQTIFKDLIP